MHSVNLDRRRLLNASGTATLSAAAVTVLAGWAPGLALAQGSDMSKDVQILNVALGLEHEAINAYQLGAKSGLLQKPALDVAVLFQGHHKSHRDALIVTIEKLGGRPVTEKSPEDYAKALQADTLKNQGDVLNLAARLEMGAANAYLVCRLASLSRCAGYRGPRQQDAIWRAP